MQYVIDQLTLKKKKCKIRHCRVDTHAYLVLRKSAVAIVLYRTRF